MKKYGIHTVVGTLAFLFTLMISIGNNTFSTSILRAFWGFIIFFLVMFPISWYFRRKGPDSNGLREQAGQSVNIQTPDEDILQQLTEHNRGGPQNKNEDNEFVPLAPPTIRKKANKESTLDAEGIANAVRILSNQ